MAIAVISSINKTSNGTITIPAGTTIILAFVEGSTTPPKIVNVSMEVIGAIEQNGIIPALSVHQYKTPAITTLAFTFTGTYVHFTFLSGADGNRPGSISVYNAGGVYTGNIASSASDVVFAVLRGSVGPCVLKGDSVEMSYLLNNTLSKVGYIAAAGALLLCLSQDSGVSEGYWADGGQYWVEGSYTPQWYEYIPHWIPGHWTSGNPVWVPGHWVYSQSGGGTYWEPGHFEYVDVWVPGFYDYDLIVHPPETVAGHWEDYADTWVPAGSSQLSAVFVSIRTTQGGEFVSRPIVFQ